jgi:hypothetical protein
MVNVRNIFTLFRRSVGIELELNFFIALSLHLQLFNGLNILFSVIIIEFCFSLALPFFSLIVLC